MLVVEGGGWLSYAKNISPTNFCKRPYPVCLCTKHKGPQPIFVGESKTFKTNLTKCNIC